MLYLQSFKMMTLFSFYWVLLGLLAVDVQSSNTVIYKPTVPPMASGHPFIVAWNAPTKACKLRFNVSLDLRLFDLKSSPSEGIVDQNLTLFYKERLGFYPYYNVHNVSINGGVPQNASLQNHLDQMVSEIKKYMPSVNKNGLAVIDWEEWRPIWIRNWQLKDMYRQASQRLVASRHPDWTVAKVNTEARHEFEIAAREFMEETLRYAGNSRPHQLWGFYLFPDCYNHNYHRNWHNYTGKCPDVEMSRNDQLWWLWEASTALYPSIYLEPFLRSSLNGRKFVHYRVKEAMRIAKQHKNYSLPVYVYTRPTYKNLDLLSQMDLISTIGESAAQGAAGVIFWGDAEYTKNKEICQNLKSFLDEDLGRYIVNVTSAAYLCSQVLCGGNGRCVRKDNFTNAFLHLSSTSFRIVQESSGSNAPVPMRAEGQLSLEDIALLHSQFQCQCYLGSPGHTCGIYSRMYNGVESIWLSRNDVQSWLIIFLLLILLDW